MLEAITSPRKAGEHTWKMLIVGLLYASVSVILVKVFFARDAVLSQNAGILVVTFCVMFSLPYMYFIIKREEREDEEIEGLFRVWRVHKDALLAFMWLFLGFIVAFAFWFIIFSDGNLFNAQLETYCMINSPGNIDNCINLYGPDSGGVTAAATKGVRFISILENNIYVMIFTLLFSLIFGAGAIFILAWNASVISGAIGIFTQYKTTHIPLGVLRYMVHGFPEIAAYFITALAGGIFGVGALKHGIKHKKFMHVTENAIILLFIALLVLVIAAFIEVYFTPIFFG